MTRHAGWHTEDPVPDPARPSTPPATAQAGGAKHMKELVGKSSHLPKQRIAAKIIHGSITNRELIELFDPLLDYCAPVIEAPGSKSMSARYVGEHVAFSDHLEVSKQEATHAIAFLKWPAAFDRKQTCAVERARCSPEAVLLRAVERGATVVAEPLPDPAVTGHLEHVSDTKVFQGRHHGPGEEALVESERDLE